jgi:hypothetical protein
MPAPTPVRAPKPKPVYPRPPLVHDHTTLFQEPAYPDGQPYVVPDDEEDEDSV